MMESLDWSWKGKVGMELDSGECLDAIREPLGEERESVDAFFGRETTPVASSSRWKLVTDLISLPPEGTPPSPQ